MRKTKLLTNQVAGISVTQPNKVTNVRIMVIASLSVAFAIVLGNRNNLFHFLHT